MRTHFIAIGGSAMHNLALALHQKGYIVTGSDDAIFEPSKTRLEKKGLLPAQMGWFPEKTTADIDAVLRLVDDLAQLWIVLRLDDLVLIDALHPGLVFGLSH